jgi:hypothetical protein
MEYKSYKNNTIFIDMLFILLLGMMVVMMFMSVKAKINQADIKHNAEYMITVTWPVSLSDDVDTWIEDPLGNKIWYNVKDLGVTHLDRDDLGSVNDTIEMPDGKKVIIPYNEEKTSIRGFIKGEWVLNIHLYSKRGISARESKPVPVEVRIEKLNPSSKTVFYKKVDLINHWEEITITRFTMLENGDIFQFDNLEKSLIESRRSSGV